MITEIVDIAFCYDSAYLQPLTVALWSLLHHARSPQNLRIWLVGNPLNFNGRESLFRLVTGSGAMLKERWLEDNDPRLANTVASGYFSRATYYRLLLPDIVPKSVRRLIYLDCDLLIRHPIEELSTIDLQGLPTAAVMKPVPDNHFELGLKSAADYFNAGVMVMDLEQWRNLGLHDQALAYSASHRGSMPYHDQDALNAVINGKWARLDPRWNQQFRFFSQTAEAIGLSPAELRRVRKHPFVVHYTTSSKPWHANNAHPFRRAYFAALDQTEFRGWRPKPISLSSRIRTCLCRMIPAYLWPSVLRNRYRSRYHRIKQTARTLAHA